MPAFKLIHAVELDEFTAALKTYGWQKEDFSVAEEEYDPATACTTLAAGPIG